MKNYSLIAVALLSLITCVHSQEVHFGVKGGINVSNVETSGGPDYGGKFGAHIGGLAHIHLEKHFAIQPELVYSSQGGHNDDLNTTLKLNYVNIPVLIQYMTDNGFRLQTGPQLGFLTLAKTQTGNVEINRKDDISSVDFSWAFGASYLFPQDFGIDARFNLGLTNINDDNDIKAKNRVFQVGIFYQFMKQHHTKKK